MASLKNLSEKSSPGISFKEDILLEKPWFVWVLMFIFWTLVTALYNTADYVMSLEFPEKYVSFDLYKSVLTSILIFYSWFVFTPLIFWFGRKFGFGTDRNSVANLILHLILSVLTVISYLFISTALLHLSGLGDVKTGFVTNVVSRLYQTGHYQLIVYWAILGLGFSIDHYKKFRERENEAARLLLRSSKLESQLAKAQLDALKMQLHPHFLFNTLHAISALVEDNPKRARRVIARLGELLRSTLDIADRQTITLEQEIALTKLYLDIERERFQDSLQVKIDVPAEVLECLVPSLILQPLIENAIKHGIADEEKTAVIEIRVLKMNGEIKIFVEDNGPGFAENFTEGIGLSNTKARLEQIYGREDQSFQMYNSEQGGGGAAVEISFPCQERKDEDG